MKLSRPALATGALLAACGLTACAVDSPATVAHVAGHQAVSTPVPITWACLPDQAADIYTLTLSNTGPTATLPNITVGIFDSSGQEIGTDSPPVLTIAGDTTYRFVGQLWTSELSGLAYSCKVLVTS